MMALSPRARDRIAAAAFAGVVGASDLLPPRIRYGYVHPLSRRLWSRPLASVPAAVPTSNPVGRPSDSRQGIVAAVVTDHLDIGGIGSVVEMLARGFGAEGVRPIVVCPGNGARAARLRDAGVQVVVADAGVEAALAGADAVQLHSAPPRLELAALRSGKPLVTVMHNTEIHYTQPRWRDFGALMAASAAGVAVSETVRSFHALRLPDRLRERLCVIPNGSSTMAPVTGEMRRDARAALEHTLGEAIGDDVVFACLARYDSQKNIAGLVSSFARAAEEVPAIRLVCAGDPSDWAELRRADALRRCSPVGDRVHLLGNSDAATVLAAADAFILDSFFEGWPVAATEAAAMGLPLLLSDVGGASELVATDPARSMLVPNPSGDPAAVSDRAVARARRVTRHQRNADHIAEALRTIAGRRTMSPPRSTLSTTADMVAAHAAVLHHAVDTR